MSNCVLRRIDGATLVCDICQRTHHGTKEPSRYKRACIKSTQYTSKPPEVVLLTITKKDLLPCDFRVGVTDDKNFCRNPAMVLDGSNIVTNLTCSLCQVREYPSYERVYDVPDNMLPLLSTEEQQKIKAGPSLARRAINLTVSVIKHVVNCMPTCTQEEIDSRIEQCRSCVYFKDVCTHHGCGCPLHDTKKFMSKLGWADQECPILRWSKIKK